MKNFVTLALFLFQLVFSYAEAQEQLSDQHIQIQILAPKIFSQNDETLIGLHFQPEEHWHVYWKNPGDSGAAPKFNFQTTTAHVGEAQWPYPQRMPVAHLTNLGYEGDVTYLFSVKPNNGKSVELEVDLEWLVCKVECVPGFGKLKINRPVHDQASSWNESDFSLIKKFSSRVPAGADGASFQITSITAASETVRVKVNASEADFAKIEIYPENGEVINPTEPSRVDQTQEIIFKLNPGVSLPQELSFVAVLNEAAWAFANRPLTTASASAAKTDLSSLPYLFLLAFLGGFILTRIAITKTEQHKSCRSSSLKQTSPPGQNSQWRKVIFHALSALAFHKALLQMIFKKLSILSSKSFLDFVTKMKL